jgi:N-acetylglucosamine-1-phosphate uridyltransferase (contains nucleotidyltransferase and I-patch acetyltransferase domains)
MNNTVAIVLAAGKGTRMKSRTPKVLHEILGKPIILYVLDALKAAGIKDTITVAGHGIDLLKEVVKDSRIVEQKELLGSGDAVATARKALEQYSGDVLVICGDTPLVRSDTIKAIIEKHKSSGADLTILTAKLKDPMGYGRIIRDGGGSVQKIVEEENASLYEEGVNEVNVGTYCYKAEVLFKALGEVKPDSRKKEIFITDTIEIMYRDQKRIESVEVDDVSEMTGINSRQDLAEATQAMKSRVLAEIMSGGVTIEDPQSTTIYRGVTIGPDSVIHPNTVIQSDVAIGERCHIGPFARIRPQVRIGDGVEIGNFVELVRTTVGSGSKVKHHTYLGDTTVGENVNIGAGTITANYDGKEKHKTVIEDNAFIGVGAILIAPVKIGSGAIVGAGSVVPKNHDVPKGATVVGVPARLFTSNTKKK